MTSQVTGPETPPGNIFARFRRSPIGQTVAIRSFRYYWASAFFYFLVFGTQRFTFIWLVLELSDNAALAGVTAFALGFPAFFITLPAGAYADRLDEEKWSWRRTSPVRPFRSLSRG